MKLLCLLMLVSLLSCPVSATAVDHSAKAANEEVLDRIKGYRPLALDEGCVVNAIAFRYWIGRELPGVDAWQVTLVGRVSGTVVHHEANIVRVGGEYYLHENYYGLTKIPMTKRQRTAGDIEKITNYARDTFFGVFRPEISRGRIPTRPLPEGTTPTAAAFDMLRECVPTELISFHGTEMLAFVDGNRLGVYCAKPGQAGTVRAKLNYAAQALGGICQIASYISKRKGASYISLRGSI